MKARKKPAMIEAVISLGSYGEDRNFSERPKWLERAIYVDKKTGFFDVPEKLAIHTIEGSIYAIPGDYATKGVSGELYPCKLDIFEETYGIIE